MEVKVGCCGLPGGMKRYFQEFKLVEINSTFYRLPMLKTAERWREQAPSDFDFSVKCFQGVTHPVTSPTWRRSGIKLTGKEKYGFLQPTREVFDSWKQTLEICRALDAKMCLIQLPARFKETIENIRNAEKFFSKAERDKAKIALELRGWSQEGFKKLCEGFDLISCVDPFAAEPVHFGEEGIAYLRLHGSPPGKQMYKYKYTKRDLLWLIQQFKSIEKKFKVRKVYCFLNNIFMREDAIQLKRLLQEVGV